MLTLTRNFSTMSFERLAFLPDSSDGEMIFSGSQYSERLAFLSETLTVGLQSESVDFKEKKADGGNSVGEIPSYRCFL